MSDTVNVKEMVVDASYTGPRLEEECIITKEFVTNMVLHFKQCQTIHSRCAVEYVLSLMNPCSEGFHNVARYAFEILLQTKCILEELPSVVDVEVPEVRIHIPVDYTLTPLLYSHRVRVLYLRLPHLV